MFKKLILSIAKAFKKNNIPYIILGGQAVLLYGEPRLTKDIDITVGLNIDAVDTIANILKKFALVPIPEDFHQFVKKIMVLPLINKEIDLKYTRKKLKELSFEGKDFLKTFNDIFKAING